jgi:basic amino acid/polyamine antiporter, APA family
MIVYAVTIAALPRAPGRPRLNAIHYSLGTIGVAVCVWAAAQADAMAWLTLGELAAAGMLLYFVASLGRRAG